MSNSGDYFIKDELLSKAVKKHDEEVIFTKNLLDQNQFELVKIDHIDIRMSIMKEFDKFRIGCDAFHLLSLTFFLS